MNTEQVAPIQDPVGLDTAGAGEIGFSVPVRYNASAVLFDDLVQAVKHLATSPAPPWPRRRAAITGIFIPMRTRWMLCLLKTRWHCCKRLTCSKLFIFLR